MTGLKLLAYKDLARVLEMAGFHWKRVRGSHNTFQSDDGRIIVIPDHGNRVVMRPLLRKIIRDVGITVDQYNELVDRL